MGGNLGGTWGGGGVVGSIEGGIVGEPMTYNHAVLFAVRLHIFIGDVNGKPAS